jgi:N-acetylglucosaminyl-diphospho-decaprenol L-rhamnosyltransferase
VAVVDVVVVSYNSRAHLRACVAALAGVRDVHVIVVDNASSDDSLATVADLPVTLVPQAHNLGFGQGCNAGWRRGEARYVLFLNPDAVLEPAALERLTATLHSHPEAAAVAPRIVHDGALVHSLRRFPRLRSTYARALFLHRLFPSAPWVDEVVRVERAYAQPGAVEWASGACLLVRRDALERVRGFDEGFFLYCEETDLCRRLWNEGLSVLYEPRAECAHVGGASAPRASLRAVLATSRIRYARKHRGRVASALERLGIALEALTRGHFESLRATVRPS